MHTGDVNEKWHIRCGIMIIIKIDWRLFMNVYISSIVIIDSKKESHTIATDSKMEVEIVDITHQQHTASRRSNATFQKPETTVIIKNTEVQKAIKPFASKEDEVVTFTLRMTSATKIYGLINASVLKEEESSTTIYAPCKISTRRNIG